MATIPVIDLAPFWQNEGVVIGAKPTPDQLRVASQIDKANQEFGFMAAKNFGISKRDVERYVEGARMLFDMPKEAKKKLKETDEVDTGYVPPERQEVQHGGLQASKEAYKIRIEEDYRGCPKLFEDTASELFSRLEEIKKRYCFAAALALGLDPNEVWGMHQTKEFTSIRYNHYAPFDVPEGHGEPVFRLGAHTDFGTQTFLLLANGARGLEIQPRGEDWLEVKVPADVHCVVNIGDMWETMTNGRWKAVRHRVMLRNKEFADTERYTIACFLNPPGSVRVAPFPKFLQKEEISRYKPYVAGERFGRLIEKIMLSTYVMEEKEPA